MSPHSFSRRSFLAACAASLALRASNKQIPIGLELYSVRNALSQDLSGTVQQVAHMGYRCVEFFAPYYSWTPDYAKQVRQQLDGFFLFPGYGQGHGAEQDPGNALHRARECGKNRQPGWVEARRRSFE